MTRITVVNDNQDFLELIRDILDDDRYDVTTIDGDVPDALERIRASRPELLMIDLRLKADGLHGWEIARDVRRDPAFDRLPILLCSGDIVALREVAEQLDDERSIRMLEKPFSIEQLTETVDALLADAVAG